LYLLSVLFQNTYWKRNRYVFVQCLGRFRQRMLKYFARSW